MTRLVAVACLSACTKSPAPPAPAASSVVPSLQELTAEHMGLRCALSRMYLHDDYTVSTDPLRKAVFVAPDGRKLAIISMPGARVFDLDRGKEYLIGARPFLWSADAQRLYLLGGDRKFYSFADGRISAEPWLDEAFADSLHAGSVVTFSDFIAAGDGLIAVTRAANRIDVFNMADRSSFRVHVGSRWRSMRSFSQLLVGWNADRGEPAVFIAHQDFEGSLVGTRRKPHDIIVAHRIDVYRPDGGHEFGAETSADEAAFLPLLAGGRVRLLARQGEFRCLASIDTRGRVTPDEPCDADVDNAYLDREGRVMATKPFGAIWPRSLRQSEPGAPEYIGTLPDHRSLFLARAGNADELWRMKGGSAPERVALGAGRCSDSANYPEGEPIRALANGFPAHGFLFRAPAGTPTRGLIMRLHGGPYGTALDRLVRPFDLALNQRGYAIVDVNYRGSPGNGRAVLEKAWGGDWPGMIDDAEALRARASGMLDLPPAAPTFLHGVSYGGFITIEAALQRRAFRGFILEAGACSLGHDVSNLGQEGKARQSLQMVSDPGTALHGLRIATRADGGALQTDLCGRRLPDGTRMLVVHSKDDPNVPFANISRFLSAQDRQRMELFDVTSNAGGHNLMTMAAHTANPQDFARLLDGMLQFLETGRPPGGP